ncbi:endonuclease/exonuclease/phosphatase family protein [Halalkalibaculum sp. DA384]|uniref:endonuclease/exonuclease/phosphatase family protein n=1 Tax=Halalkalibaculum sp. DA384 TaxID=3373606 RepID=UPI003754BA27
MNILFSNMVFGFLILMLTGVSESKAQTNVSVMTYNIRYDNPDDGNNRWDLRKAELLNQVKFFDPDFLGTQEALVHQVEYMDRELAGMDYIGIGRAQGGESDEYSAIFYDTGQYELIAESDSTIWLSETPGQVSTGWDAALPRIMTWGKFRDRSTGSELYVFNTHFDHRGEQARAESAKLILQIIDKIAGDDPVVLTGDFNVEPGSRPYSTLTSSSLRDAWQHSTIPAVGPDFTYSGWEVAESLDNQGRRIDYVFVNDGVEVRSISALTTFRDGRFLSDHLAVFSVLELW